MIIIGKGSLHYEFLDNGMEVMVNILKSEFSIVRYLDEPVHIEEGVTVGDLFEILAAYKNDIDFAFDSSLGGYPLELYLAELEEKIDPDKNFLFAEFTHETSMEKDILNEWTRFCTMGLDQDDKEKPEEIVPYSVELSPIGSYKHLELRINPIYRIFDEESPEEILLECYKPFTLHEIIHALLYEISYHGTPMMRKQVTADITAILKDEGAITASEIFIKKEEEIDRLERDLQESIEKEDYEKSAQIRDKISQLKKEKSEKNRNKPSN